MLTREAPLTRGTYGGRPTCRRSLGSVGLFGALVLMVVTWAEPARAIPEYTGILLEELSMPCLPACIVCHLTNQGGANTWGRTEVGFSASFADPSDPDSLRDQIAAMEVGTPAEQQALALLRQGRDPILASIPNASPLNICAPSYGCGARVAARGPVDGWGLLAAALIAGALALGLTRRPQRRGTGRFTSGL